MPVAWSAALEQAAQKHARGMAARRTLSHRSSDPRNGSWMRSPGHCANMMSASFREVGVAAASVPGDTYGWYRAMVLGSPAR